MRIREISWLLLLLSASAFAGGTTSKQLDSIHHSGGGASLSVPSVGSAVISDSATQTLTNKTINCSNNTCTNFPGGGTWEQDVFTTCNGSNTSFTLSNTPTANAILQLHLDGALLAQGSGLDYTISSTTITLATACAKGQRLIAVYAH